MLEGNGFKNEFKDIFDIIEKTWNKSARKAVSVGAPFIGRAVGAKTKDFKIGEATSSTLKSVSGKI